MDLVSVAVVAGLVVTILGFQYALTRGIRSDIQAQTARLDATNARIDLMGQDINARFDATNARIDGVVSRIEDVNRDFSVKTATVGMLVERINRIEQRIGISELVGAGH